MSDQQYQSIALSWQPGSKGDSSFVITALVFMLLALGLGFYLNSVEVPEKDRRVRAEIPERVAKFIQKKPKPEKPKPEKPKQEKVEKDKPKIEEKKPEEVKVERPKIVERKPLTDKEKASREKAKSSGLMAHLGELGDLVEAPVGETFDVDIQSSEGANVAVTHNVDSLTSGAASDSGGVDSGKYATKAGTTQLAAADIAAAKAALDERGITFVDKTEQAKSGPVSRDGEGYRSEEEIVLVIDKSKNQFQTIYNRARRKNPSLKGRLVLEITIEPDGKVSAVNIISSELNDASLEQRIVARVKNLSFGQRPVETVTVTYPIEFLPY